MSILRALFGPGKDEIWAQLCQEIGGNQVAGGWLSGIGKVQVKHGDWTITLDTFTVSTGKSGATFTRLRAPFINRTGLQFQVYPQNFWATIGKFFGMQDVTVGDPAFDDRFVIKGNDEGKLRQLFANVHITNLLLGGEVGFQLIDDNPHKLFGRDYPEQVDQLYFVTGGVVTDLAKLRLLFDLFAETLDELAKMDPACEDEVTRHLYALQLEGNVVTEGNAVIYDGQALRAASAKALGQLRERRAVTPLRQMLTEPDSLARREAMLALAEIGDTAAIADLIPFLGEPLNRGLHIATQALRKLAGKELVDAFFQQLAGTQDDVSRFEGPYRSAFVHAFIGRLQDDEASVVAHAARALGKLHAREALDELKAKAGLLSFASSEVKDACRQAIEQIEQFAALPRSTSAVPVETGTLPRVAERSVAPPTDTLPRESSTQNGS